MSIQQQDNVPEGIDFSNLGKRPMRQDVVGLGLVFLFVVVVVLIVLALLGPAVGNVFSNITMGAI